MKEKHSRINLDSTKYGTFAEIGAGQEVARHFFQAGGAAGTVAKTMSAYDMKFSDKIYGEAGRYVSRKRLVQMMAHESSLLQERLSRTADRKASSLHFQTLYLPSIFIKPMSAMDGWVSASNLNHLGEMHDIIMHVRMLDRENRLQQEAVGMLGVNLVYGAFHLNENPDEFIQSLADGIDIERIEIDMIEFNGPDFEKFDNRILCLKLTQSGLTDAIMFDKQGFVVQASEVSTKNHV